MAKTTNNTTRDETEAEFAGTLQLLLDRCEASVLRAKKLELELKNAKVSRERAAARARELETELGVRTEASNKKIESLSPPRLLEAATEVLRILANSSNLVEGAQIGKVRNSSGLDRMEPLLREAIEAAGYTITIDYHGVHLQGPSEEN